MLLSQANLQVLQTVPLFRDIEPDSALTRLAASLQEVNFPANHLILKQGTVSGKLYVLLTGRVQVRVGNAPLTVLGPGAHFGEISLFDGQPHSASIVTLEPSTCLVLGRQQMHQAIADSPELGLSLIRGLVSRIRYLNERLSAWLRGLLTVAWADGHYNTEEKKLIESLVKDLCPQADLGTLPTIDGPELAELFRPDPAAAENFLRAAMIVALANGTYSEPEDRVLRNFARALGLSTDVLDALQVILIANNQPTVNLPDHHTLDVLHPVREWLDEMVIDSPATARFLCKLIPSQCPFERDVVLFGHKIIHIPPMCKLNPLYEQLVGLRFRALSYLADVCKEDISAYLT
ncbi:MAG: cyclic nucleotide-binding domain-containing protein [Aphanocapsa sp. GSE-SYN-MK-11-07L]|jgi:CRP-like cAMP-binding protein|nr:cyclic nucleotide-binding domain-containing protein [Aphanocapsa sp. GSE-SYN-MK-11-07L]